jgi:hypothetical protein
MKPHYFEGRSQMSSFIRRCRQVFVTLAVLGLLIPSPRTVFGAGHADLANRAESLLMDVGLSELGVLQGQFLDTNGQPVANAVVHLHDGQKLVMQCTTDPLGHFRFEGLRGGVYAVYSQQAFTGVRAWAKDAAPPSASQGILLVEGTTQRAQMFAQYLNRIGIAGIAVLAAIVTIVAVAAAERGESS